MVYRPSSMVYYAMPRKTLLILALLSLTTTFPIRLTQMEWGQGEWIPIQVRSARPFRPASAADLDGDGRAETIRLMAGRLDVSRGVDLIWETPDEWIVISTQRSDFNRDGFSELVLLVWRPFKPWPVDEWLPSGGRIAAFQDSAGRSCHIILWGWDGDRWREIWAGSAMAEPVMGFLAADWNRDGRPELATVESSYIEPGRGSALALWEWNGFGFTLLDRRVADIGGFVFQTDADGTPSVVLETTEG